VVRAVDDRKLKAENQATGVIISVIVLSSASRMLVVMVQRRCAF